MHITARHPGGPAFPAEQLPIFESISDSPISVVTVPTDVTVPLPFQKSHLLDFVGRALSSTPPTPPSTVSITLAARFRGDSTGVTFNDDDPRPIYTGNFSGIEILITGLTLDSTKISSVAASPVAICACDPPSPNNSATEYPRKSTSSLTSASPKDRNISAQYSLILN